LNQILKRQTSPFHYGSKFPAVTITVFITILEQNRKNSCQSRTKFSEVNVKDTFTSHIDSKIFLTFLLPSLSIYIFTIWKCIVYYRICRDGIFLHVCIHKQMEILQTYITMVKAFYEDHFSLIKYDLSCITYVLAFNSQV
jgi:hypothetical protein